LQRVPDEPLSIQSSTEGATVRVRLTGELDLHTATALSEHLASLTTQVVEAVVVDVSQLTFLDSSGLRALLSARDELQAVGATLTLQGVGGAVERVLGATGLLGLLTGDRP
jgi:anti-sigma B factor antagonist